MSERARPVVVLVALLVIAGFVFLCGITWGLPSRAVDAFLFGDRRPWTGAEIIALAGTRGEDRRRGADVDVDPISDRSQPLVLNATDAQRAEIVRRYRLYTHQPDEMITLMALASMRPGQGDLDPKLYQYGGLWIYPVGAVIRLGSMMGLLTLRADPAYYLDDPRAFGRLYLGARLYCVAWALIGVAAVFAVGRRLSPRGLAPAALAALLVVTMPVVINMAHEAKPHLPAAVLMLLAVLAARRYVQRGTLRRLLLTGALCGAAFGMVLSALPVFVLLPVMVLLRRDSWRRRGVHLLTGCGCGAAVYLLTNPYIAINAVTNHEVLRSNFGNSLAMYEIARLAEGFVNAARLVAEGMSPPLAMASVLLLLVAAAGRMTRRGEARAPGAAPLHDDRAAVELVAIPDAVGAGPGATGPRFGPETTLAVLLMAPALLILLQFVLLAAGKPGEYGRFAVYPDIVLAVMAVSCLWRRVRRPVPRAAVAVLLLVGTAFHGYGYLAGFRADAGPDTGRIRAAVVLEELRREGAKSLVVSAEPAPYCLPPANLFEWVFILPPRYHDWEAGPPLGDVYVRPVDTAVQRNGRVPPGHHAVEWERDSLFGDQEISWAGKRFQITRQRD